MNFRNKQIRDYSAQLTILSGQSSTDGFVPLIISGVATLSGNVQKIWSTTSVDLKTTGNTTLYTVPTGKTFISSMLILSSTASGITVPATISCGIAAGEVDIISDISLTAFTATLDAWVIPISQETRIGASTDVIKFRVATAATGTSQTAQVYLVGYLL